jgi:hypothetical protein
MAIALGETIETLLEAHSAEIAERRLSVRLALDSAWRAESTPDLVAAFRGLLQLVFATLPDGCEVYLESARSVAPVSRIGDGMVTLRWQVPGVQRSASEQGVTPLRPRIGDAEAHVDSPAVGRVREAFHEAGWIFEIEAVPPGCELFVRVRSGAGPRRAGV